MKENNERKKKKFGLWYWLGGSLATISLAVTSAFAAPTINRTSSSFMNDQFSSSSLINPQSTTLIGIELERIPYKTTFTTQEAINTAGGKIRLRYSDSTSALLDMNDNMIDYSNLNLSTLGSKNVYIRYQGLVTNYSVNIIDWIIPVTNIVIDSTILELNQGSGYQISASIFPINATNQGLTYSSSDTNIVSVDNFGYVIGLKPGVATISVIAENKEAKVEVTIKEVKEPVTVTYLRELVKTLQDKVNNIIVDNFTPENYQLILDIYNDAISDIYNKNTQSEALEVFNVAIYEINNVPENIIIILDNDGNESNNDDSNNQNELDEETILDLIDLGWIPISSETELRLINENTTGSKTFDYGGSQEFTFEFSSEYSNSKNALKNNYFLTRDIEIEIVNINNWTAIGNSTTPFVGKFDGKGYSISNIFILDLGNAIPDNQGFFGYSLNAEIKNISLNNVWISASSSTRNVGGLVGQAVNTQILNSSVISEITAFKTAGGLIGYSINSLVENSFANTIIDTYGENGAFDLGGLIGAADGAGHTDYLSKIINSFSTGTIKNTGGYQNGGLIGASYRNGDQQLIIIDSYSEMNITANYSLGGLVGYNSSSANSGKTTLIKNSYSYSTLNILNTTDPHKWKIGGIVGEDENTSDIYELVEKTYFLSDESVNKDVKAIARPSTSNLNQPSSVTALSVNNFKLRSSFNFENFDNNWVMTNTINKPTLKNLLPTLILVDYYANIQFNNDGDYVAFNDDTIKLKIVNGNFYFNASISSNNISDNFDIYHVINDPNNEKLIINPSFISNELDLKFSFDPENLPSEKSFKFNVKFLEAFFTEEFIITSPAINIYYDRG